MARQPVRECTRTLNHDSADHGVSTTAAGLSVWYGTIRHVSTFGVLTTAASGPSRSLEHSLVLCLFSLMADRSDRGSANPSGVTLLPQVGRRVLWLRFWVSSSLS